MLLLLGGPASDENVPPASEILASDGRRGRCCGVAGRLAAAGGDCGRCSGCTPPPLTSSPAADFCGVIGKAAKVMAGVVVAAGATAAADRSSEAAGAAAGAAGSAT
jgi:hypothetical protein